MDLISQQVLLAASACMLACAAYSSLNKNTVIKRKKCGKRRFWVRPIYQKRKEQGDYHNLMMEMRLHDTEMFFHFTRMSVSQFDELLSLFGPLLVKKSNREPIAPEQRLAITLRYKDGKAYPWPLMVSQMIISPQSANQTVYTRVVTKEDAGSYTCLLRNDTVIRSHTIQLKVYEDLPDDPKITYVSQDTSVPLAQGLRLFCEAFAGRYDLPDAHNEAVWRKTGRNGTLNDLEPRIRQEKISREDGQTFGTYLIIEDMKLEDFGEYICKISKPGKSIEQHVYVKQQVKVEYFKPEPPPYGKIFLVFGVIVFLCMTVYCLNHTYGLSLRVKFKDNFCSEEADSKLNDVLVLYSKNDRDLVLGVLLHTLETRYRYKCVAHELPLNVGTWYTQFIGVAQQSRRVVAVMSPAVFADVWDTSEVYQALKQLQGLGSKLIVVTLKRLPIKQYEVKNSSGETLKSLAANLPVINWERDEAFWLSLRLRLPPMRGDCNRHADLEIETAPRIRPQRSSRLTSNCSAEGFDHFV